MPEEDQPKPFGTPVVVTDDDMRASFAGPAFHSNKIFATSFPYGLRLAFMEQNPDAVAPQFRSAVILSYPDALALRDLLSRQLKDIEPAIQEAFRQAREAQEAAQRAGKPDAP